MTPHSTAELMILYTTIGSLPEAEKLAKTAVETKHAACVNIIPGMQAVYVWKEAVEQASECVMIFKTSPEQLPALEAWLLQNHPYDTPAILKWQVGTSKDFHNYIVSNLSQAYSDN